MRPRVLTKVPDVVSGRIARPPEVDVSSTAYSDEHRSGATVIAAAT